MICEDARHDAADMQRESCKHEDHELTEAGSIWCPSCRREFSTVNGAILYDEDEDGRPKIHTSVHLGAMS